MSRHMRPLVTLPLAFCLGCALSADPEPVSLRALAERVPDVVPTSEAGLRSTTSAQDEMPSRFVTIEPGRLTITEDEYEGLNPLVQSIAAMKPQRTAELVIDYGRTRSGLIRAIKALHLLDAEQRALVLHELRPAELRAILDSPVTHEPRTTGEGTSGTPPSRETSPQSPRESTAPAQRYQIAGAGQSAWQTVLDTATGVVYNYRNIEGQMKWVPITSPLLIDKR
jgi:hypothetical protein